MIQIRKKKSENLMSIDINQTEMKSEKNKSITEHLTVVE